MVLHPLPHDHKLQSRNNVEVPTNHTRLSFAVLDARFNGAASPEARLIAQDLHVVEDSIVGAVKASREGVATSSADEVAAVDGVAVRARTVVPRDAAREPDSGLSTTSKARVRRTGPKPRRTS